MVSIHNFVTPRSYTAVDHDPKVIEYLKKKKNSGTYYLGDLMNTKIKGKFNCVIWTGNEIQPEMYSNVVVNYKSNLTPDAVIIIDYMDLGDGFREIGNGFKIIDGCKLHMPFVDTSETLWPDVNKRVIEVLKISKRSKFRKILNIFRSNKH
jgi:hypothetical protein